MNPARSRRESRSGTGAKVVERPDGVKIGSCFIAGILLVSLVSRLRRSFDLRVADVELDPMAELFVRA
jgi:hypothetical protein